MSTPSGLYLKNSQLIIPEFAKLQLAKIEQTRSLSIITLDDNNAFRYYKYMIKTFADKETEKLFNRIFSKKLLPEIQRAARYKLEILNAAETITDPRFPPANHLEKLLGDRSEQYSIRINDRWRLCFNWHNGCAYDVEIVDYH